MCVCGCGTGWGWETLGQERCQDCGSPRPTAEKIGCGQRWDPTECPFCRTPGDYLSGRCSNAACMGSADFDYNPTRRPIWDPERCPFMAGGKKCQGHARHMDYRDWGLEPRPELPPLWASYWIGVARSLSRAIALGGMGGAVYGPVAEAEMLAALESFPRHQHAAIRVLVGEVEAGEADARNVLAVRDAEQQERDKAKKPRGR